MSGSRGRSPSERDRGRRGKAAPAQQASGEDVVVEVNGWTLYFHPLFLDQLERLISAAETERARRGAGGAQGANAKLLAQIQKLVFGDIPADPTRREYRQGGTLGEGRRHWFRAKFGGGRFRMFFRYRSDVSVIVYVWVNDEETLRAYGSRTDAYLVFRRMLDAGNPAEDWDELVNTVTSKEAVARARGALRRMDKEGGG